MADTLRIGLLDYAKTFNDKKAGTLEVWTTNPNFHLKLIHPAQFYVLDDSAMVEYETGKRAVIALSQIVAATYRPD